MRVPARKRKEILLSIALCVVFFVISGFALKEYLNFLETETSEVTHANQNVQGINTGNKLNIDKNIDEVKPTEILLTPTNQPTLKTSSTITPTDSPKSAQNQLDSKKPDANSEIESSYSQVLDALNEYRNEHGVGRLEIDSKLQEFSQSRADYFNSKGDMDNHEGFQRLLNDSGFEKMGFNALGENSSFGEWSDAQNLIRNIYGSSSSHNESQLKSEWTHVGIGVNGNATNIMFGGLKR